MTVGDSSTSFRTSWYIVIGALLAPAVHAGLQDGGPHNVVGFFTERVTLYCNRDIPGNAVRWSFVAPGTSREQPVPGRHSYFSSSYGRHSLHLENLQRSDAGVYVCRSADDPQSFEPASSFVVVVADKPVCRTDYTKKTDGREGKFKLSCRIIYNGMLNLTLSVIRSSDNYTVVSENYTSDVEGSWQHMESEVAANFSGQFMCTAQFYSSWAAKDVAKNRPRSIEVPCEPALPEYADKPHDSARPIAHKTETAQTAAVSTVSSQATATDVIPTITADSISSAAAVILSPFILVIPAVVIFFFVRHRRAKRQKHQRNAARPGVSSEEPGNDADKVKKLLNEAASRLPHDSSTTNCSVQDLSVPARLPRGVENGEREDMQANYNIITRANSVCLSSGPVSVLSLQSLATVCLHSDSSANEGDEEEEDEANEQTVVPSTPDERRLAATARPTHSADT